MMPTGTTIAWCKQEREKLADQLKAMEGEKFFTGERRGLNLPWQDTTLESINECKQKIADLDALISKDSKAA